MFGNIFLLFIFPRKTIFVLTSVTIGREKGSDTDNIVVTISSSVGNRDRDKIVTVVHGGELCGV